MEPWRRELRVLECLRFLGRPGPRRAGLRELSSRLWATATISTHPRGKRSPSSCLEGLVVCVCVCACLWSTKLKRSLKLSMQETHLLAWAAGAIADRSKIRCFFHTLASFSMLCGLTHILWGTLPCKPAEKRQRHSLVVVPPLQLGQLPLLLLVAPLQFRQPQPHLYFLGVQVLNGCFQGANLRERGGRSLHWGGKTKRPCRVHHALCKLSIHS